MNWKTVNIFISSTFNDMHAERDYLVKYVFPELAEWCEKRRIRLVDIDLRWGVTSEESHNNHALRKCLENIDDTNRFFLCLIGQRRGWVPNENIEELERRRNELIDKGIDPDTIPPKYSEISKETTEEYPELFDRERNPPLLHADESKIDNYKSVTEIEIEHALLAPMYRMLGNTRKDPEEKSRAVFFERIDSFTDKLSTLQKKIYTNAAAPDSTLADIKTEELKAEIRKKISPKNIIPYSCEWDINVDTPELSEEKIDGLKVGKELINGRLVHFMVKNREFKDVVIEEIRKLILDKYPDRENEFVSDSDRYVKDKEQQELFVQTTTEGYIHRSDIEDRLKNYINGESDKALLLTAEAGLGKTTILAQYVKSGNFNDSKGIYRFCGASDLTSDPYMLWDSICNQAGIETPESYEKLSQNILPLLTQIAKCGNRHIVIDAVNQMTDGENMLYWFPNTLPAGLKVILSIKLTNENKSCISKLNNRFEFCPIGKLADFTVKRSLIEQFLKRYLKAFDEDQIREICGGIEWVCGEKKRIPFPDEHYTDNPLFLKVLLHELHFFGSFSQLPDETKKYGQTPKEAFAQMLERLEKENNAYVYIQSTDSVPFLFGLLSQARNGLSEDEIYRCFKYEFSNKTREQILGTVRFYVRQIRPFIARRDGRVDFLYDEFKLAAAEKYAGNEHRNHFALVKCFHSVCDPFNDMSFMGVSDRGLLEYTYHLSKYSHQEFNRLYINIPYLTARCSCTSIVSLLDEMKINSVAIRYEKLILRYKSQLSEYKFALPSLLYYYGNSDDREIIEKLHNSGVLRHTWLKSRLIEWKPSESSSMEQFFCNKTAEYTLRLPLAYNLAEKKPLAVISLGNTAVIINADALEEYNGSIYSNTGSPIVTTTLTPDGSCVAIGCGNGQGFIYKLKFSENSLSASMIHVFEFLPTEDGRAIFAFEESKALWYQDLSYNLVRISIDANDEKKFDVQEDITSICVGKSYLYFSRWHNKDTAVEAISLTNLNILSPHPFEDDDVMVFAAAPSDIFICGSMRNKNGYMICIINANQQVIYSTSLKEPIACATFSDDKNVMIIPQLKTMDSIYALNLLTQKMETVYGRIDRVRDVKIKRNPDGSYTLISAYAITKFDVLEKAKENLERISDACEKNGELLVASVNMENQLQIFKHEQNLLLKSNADGEHHKVFRVKDRILVTNTPIECYLIDDSRVASPNFLQGAVAILDNSADIINFRNNCLYNGVNLLIENYINYQLSIVKLFAFENYIALSGVISGDLRDLLHSPYVLYVYKKNSNGTYNKILERYFSEVYEPVECVNYDTYTEKLYVLFGGGGDGSWHPSVAYGTVYDFSVKQEKYERLACPKTKLSAALDNQYYCSCGKGELTVNNTNDMKYATALFLDEPIRFIRSAEQNGEFIIVSGNNKIINFSILN